MSRCKKIVCTGVFAYFYKLIAPTFIFIALAISVASSAYSGEVKVSAAASMTDALTEIAQLFEKSNPGTVVKSSFASSSTLAKQIENGAPADVFISADKDWADYLQKRDLIQVESRRILLGNTLVFIAPADAKHTIKLKKEFDLAKSFKGKLCTGEPTSVPVGKYAKQALEYYDWWKTIESRIVGTEDVRTALAFVERGECSLGIVYSTDAAMSKKVKTLATFPAESHLPIAYPGALTKKAGADANKFWQFLQSPTAGEVFKKYGFIINPE